VNIAIGWAGNLKQKTYTWTSKQQGGTVRKVFNK